MNSGPNDFWEGKRLRECRVIMDQVKVKSDRSGLTDTNRRKPTQERSGTLIIDTRP